MGGSSEDGERNSATISPQAAIGIGYTSGSAGPLSYAGLLDVHLPVSSGKPSEQRLGAELSVAERLWLRGGLARTAAAAGLRHSTRWAAGIGFSAGSLRVDLTRDGIGGGESIAERFMVDVILGAGRLP